MHTPPKNQEERIKKEHIRNLRRKSNLHTRIIYWFRQFHTQYLTEYEAVCWWCVARSMHTHTHTNVLCRCKILIHTPEQAPKWNIFPLNLSVSVILAFGFSLSCCVVYSNNTECLHCTHIRVCIFVAILFLLVCFYLYFCLSFLSVIPFVSFIRCSGLSMEQWHATQHDGHTPTLQ